MDLSKIGPPNQKQLTASWMAFSQNYAMQLGHHSCGTEHFSAVSLQSLFEGAIQVTAHTAILQPGMRALFRLPLLSDNEL